MRDTDTGCVTPSHLLSAFHSLTLQLMTQVGIVPAEKNHWALLLPLGKVPDFELGQPQSLLSACMATCTRYVIGITYCTTFLGDEMSVMQQNLRTYACCTYPM